MTKTSIRQHNRGLAPRAHTQRCTLKVWSYFNFAPSFLLLFYLALAHPDFLGLELPRHEASKVFFVETYPLRSGTHGGVLGEKPQLNENNGTRRSEEEGRKGAGELYKINFAENDEDEARLYTYPWGYRIQNRGG